MGKSLTEYISKDVDNVEAPDDKSLAEWTYERLVGYINDFEATLDDEHEVGARLVSFGDSVTFHIEDIGFWGPDIITFVGKADDGSNIQLIQNISQLSVLLIAMKKEDDEPRRIGFDLQQTLKKASADSKDTKVITPTQPEIEN